MSENLTEALRMIVNDAIEFKRCVDADTEAGRCKSKDTFTAEAAVLSSVAYLERVTEPPNQPYGFTLNRAWEEVHAGWFVRTPKGEWIEVLGNDEAAGGEKRNVTLAVNGKQAIFTYDASRNVSIRKGTRGRAMDDAIDVLTQKFSGTSVIQDWS